MDEGDQRVEIQLVEVPWETAQVLIDLHVFATVVSIAAAAFALTSAWGGAWHRRAGRGFVGAFLLAIPPILPTLVMSPVTLWTGLAAVYLVWRGLWWIDRVGWDRPARASGVLLAVGAGPFAAWIASRGEVGQAIGVLLFDVVFAPLVVLDLRRAGRSADLVEHLTGMVMAVTLMLQNFLPRRMGSLRDVVPEGVVGVMPVVVGTAAVLGLRRRVGASPGSPPAS